MLLPGLQHRAAALIAAYRERRWMLATAESCTGGLVAALLTEVAGSSSVIACGFVTYSNEAKARMLGIDPALIGSVGAVSREVALAMAEGARGAGSVAVAVSITGIAGPGGGTATKPVGLVHFGLSVAGAETRHLERRYGDLGRAKVRERAVADALGLLEGAVSEPQARGPGAGSRP